LQVIISSASLIISQQGIVFDKTRQLNGLKRRENSMSAYDQDYKSIEDNDMRYFPRWEVKDQVLYNLDGQTESYEGETKDISCAGACITGTGNVSPHQKIKVVVELAEGVKIKLNAHILWVRIKNNQPQMGVTFYNTPDDVQSLILQHAFEVDRDKFVKQLYKGWENP
jgi:hypothetical protein